VHGSLVFASLQVVFLSDIETIQRTEMVYEMGAYYLDGLHSPSTYLSEYSLVVTTIDIQSRIYEG
jgi:hypothetical protein